MAAIDELIQQIADPVLRERIRAEVEDLSKQKKFGLVFENHLPEHTPLYEMPIKVGSLVMPKLKKGDELFTVKAINGDNAIVANKVTGEESELPLRSLVVAAELGEPIYPYLKYIDSISRAPDDDLWHVLIEADNYHALQLLEYLYAGKVDCIYIDPPYNSGARDWKYNNDYVDGSDSYRHSKWLSMMEKRLLIAKKLLNPDDSIMIVAIDEKEYLHLGCLLEQLFGEENIQMVTTIIKAEGTQRLNEFSRTSEYLFFVFMGEAVVRPWKDMFTEEKTDSPKQGFLFDVPPTDSRLPYRNFRRTNSANVRSSRPNQFYPIFVDKRTLHIHSVGEVMTPEVKQSDIIPPDGCFPVFPLRENGEEMIWYKTPSSLRRLIEQGYAFAQTRKGITTIQYLSSGIVSDIENGKIVITGKTDEGELLGYYAETKLAMPKSTWFLKSHSPREYGSILLRQIFAGEGRFPFPKSLYAVRDCIKLATIGKENPLILDFFAGSGTTLHAVNLLNAEEKGRYRCIMVTNNEVSDEESKKLVSDGFLPGDPDWESRGIARYVNWPRTVASILGQDTSSAPLKGQYLGSSLPLASGFMSNAAFFKLGFLDKASVALGRQFRELLPVIWMKTGCHHKCPQLQNDCSIPEMLILPENRFAVLADEMFFDEFVKEVSKYPEIESVFIVTNSDIGYQEMALAFEGKQTYQLYRDYLDNFRLNVRK